jgi:hypothetical protein
MNSYCSTLPNSPIFDKLIELSLIDNSIKTQENQENQENPENPENAENQENQENPENQENQDNNKSIFHEFLSVRSN